MKRRAARPVDPPAMAKMHENDALPRFQIVRSRRTYALEAVLYQWEMEIKLVQAQKDKIVKEWAADLHTTCEWWVGPLLKMAAAEWLLKSFGDLMRGMIGDDAALDRLWHHNLQRLAEITRSTGNGGSPIDGILKRHRGELVGEALSVLLFADRTYDLTS